MFVGENSAAGWRHAGGVVKVRIHLFFEVHNFGGLLIQMQLLPIPKLLKRFHTALLWPRGSKLQIDEMSGEAVCAKVSSKPVSYTHLTLPTKA